MTKHHTNENQRRIPAGDVVGGIKKTQNADIPFAVPLRDHTCLLCGSMPRIMAPTPSLLRLPCCFLEKKRQVQQTMNLAAFSISPLTSKASGVVGRAAGARRVVGRLVRWWPHTQQLAQHTETQIASDMRG